MADWIGAAEAAQRLGIKQASLYSYVSRGCSPRAAARTAGPACLTPPRSPAWPGGAGRAGRRVPPSWSSALALTEIAGDRLCYRGHDAIALATQRSFEDVASLLWTGSLDDAAAGPWHATPEAVAAGTAAQAALPPGTYRWSGCR